MSHYIMSNRGQKRDFYGAWVGRAQVLERSRAVRQNGIFWRRSFHFMEVRDGLVSPSVFG